ncbi:MAG: FAD-dependent thymidylate synthase [Acidobacteria bacterium]|nr:FAD-dependent thymidylate synthase [Acidobacteriota bacterium]
MAVPQFLSLEPEVKLVKAFTEPFKNIVATARTCYSNRGIVEVEELTARDCEISQSIYQAGHHTTLQHAHFQFTLNRVSRHFIWSFLHSHPFYNSEQVSQRYVEVKPDACAIPPLEGKALEVYLATVVRQTTAYSELCQRLVPLVQHHYGQRFPGRNPDQLPARRDIKKKAQELARYVLPVATFSYLYHTVSGVTLLRYWRLAQQFECPLEQRIVVGKMVEQLLECDPNFKLILEEPLPLEETPEYAFLASVPSKTCPSTRREFIDEFDRGLGGFISRLVDWKPNNERILAQSVREVLGIPESLLADKEAISLVLDPSRNRLFGEALNLSTMSKLSRTLAHAGYTFRKKLSHTADSQDQRHRMVPASRPILFAHFTETPDYVTPALLCEEAAAERIYRDTMNQTWEQIGALRKMGVPDEFALYLLPNAVTVRFTESGDLLNLHHKYTMRLCYNAQEEIWRASLEEVQQIRSINPLIGGYLLPPCTQRKSADIRPVCPEGERYCGVPVWKLQLDDYHRVI